MKRRGGALALALLVLTASPALAQDPNARIAAEGLFTEGRRLMAAGKVEEACAKFEESQRVDPALGTMLNLADCYDKLGKTASAWTTFRAAAALASTKGQADREQLARERAAALEAKLAKLTIEVSADAAVDGLVIKRDGVAIGKNTWGTPLPIDPGAHVVQATAPGKLAWSSKVQVVAKATATVRIPVLDTDVEPPAASALPAPAVTATMTPIASADEPAPGRSTQRTIGVVLGIAGASGLVAGAALWAAAVGRYGSGSADNHCRTVGAFEYCDAAGLAARNGARSFGTASTVAFIAGGALLAGGAVVFFTAPAAAPRVQVGAGVASLELRGRW